MDLDNPVQQSKKLAHAGRWVTGMVQASCTLAEAMVLYIFRPRVYTLSDAALSITNQWI